MKPVRASHQQMHQQALSNISNKTAVSGVGPGHGAPAHPAASNRNGGIKENHSNLSSYVPHKFTSEKRIQSYERGAANNAARAAQQQRYSQGRQTSNALGQPAAKQAAKVVTLTETEAKNFGNRCPNGYKKLRILGK